jgi:predicted nucleic acid-binding protein
MKKDFQVVPVDDQIAQISAELRQKYNLSMGDSMIAATASILKAVCISDDPHFKQIKEIETTWI